MAVGGVDVLAQAEAGVRQRQLHVGHPRGDPARPRPPPAATGHSRLGRAVRARRGAGATSQGSASAWSWLPGTSTTGRPASAAPELLEHRRATSSESASGRSRSSTDVAEQHDPVGAAERFDERLARLAIARDVRPAEGAEVKVGDDRGPHPEAWCQAG